MRKGPTPTPWAINGVRVESQDEHGWANDGWIIANCEGPCALANAELIGRAINAHADLLAALKWCVEYDGECLGDNPDELHAAKAAIRLAEIP